MTNLLNDCWKSTIIPLMLFAWTYVEIVSLFVMIKLHDRVPHIFMVFFGAMAIDGFLFIHIIIKHLAKPFIASKNIKQIWKTQRRPKWFRKFDHSCSLVKIRVESVGFFDKRTSLRLWHFCVDQTIALLLAKI